MTALPAVFIVSLEVCASVFACGKPCVADKAAFAVVASLCAAGVAAFAAVVDVRFEVEAAAFAERFAIRAGDVFAFSVLAVLRFVACRIADFGGWIGFGIFASAVLARLAVFACGIANIRIGRIGNAGVILADLVVCACGLAHIRVRCIFGDAGVVQASLVICALRVAAEGRNDCRRFIGTADGE